MAPKLKAVSELGKVQKCGDGWRAKVEFSGKLIVTGPKRHGPAARRKAEADLAQARCASTRDEMQQCLRDMSVASGQLGSVVAHGTGWRAKVFGAVGPTRNGRDARRKAQADLVWARQASMRDEMQHSRTACCVLSGSRASRAGACCTLGGGDSLGSRWAWQQAWSSWEACCALSDSDSLLV